MRWSPRSRRSEYAHGRSVSRARCRFLLTSGAIIGECARMAGKIKAGSKMLLVRLTPKEKAAIVAEARRNGMTIQAYVAAAMEAVRAQGLAL